MTLDNVSKMHYNKLMTGFTKLFSTIIHSTIWGEDMHVKILWITMLAMADRNGRIWASIPGLANAARVSLEQCEEALTKLSSPDKYSRSSEYNGRRIRAIEGGWEILNYLKYREMRDADERRIQNIKAQRTFRDKSADRITVSHSKPRSAQAEADIQKTEDRDTETTTTPPAAGDKLSPEWLRDLWNTACKNSKLRSCRSLTPDRKKSATARIKELTREEIEESVKRISSSPFCNGNNDRGWVADFDFLLRPSSMAKALEGVYDQRRKGPSRGRGGMPIPDPNEEA